MRLSDFDYFLPDEAIAQSPCEPRDASKMLVLNLENDTISHKHFFDLPDVLEEGDLVVMNQTRVSALRLYGTKPSGGKVEVLLLKETEERSFEALVKPAKRLREKTEIFFNEHLRAIVSKELEGGVRILQFEETENLYDTLKQFGRIPLPPYIQRYPQDDERYQTVYAQTPGSSAAPTAGLHFTKEVLEKLNLKGIDTAFITLDVSYDTFRPITSEIISEHKMHGERYVIPNATAEKIKNTKGRIIAVGTTTVRALESSAIRSREVTVGENVTDKFITPGYEFKIIDGMITNFHKPKTSMLLLVSALCGRNKMLNAYQEALNNNYRFLSFGDCMLIIGRKQ